MNDMEGGRLDRRDVASACGMNSIHGEYGS